ncbi:RNA-directed DNA polymerase [Oceanobacter kriegii]|uniref:RNA-directed DNA polymerase n=1 Tax=Oceanobacter kriegii TaxID=64972 RepID=UPI0003FB07FF|nr:RNA-directed DNA polymerase [Oceanobacter kriegii]
MPQIPSEYNQLELSDWYLTNPLLMALAWKKSHEYIRSTNWYADNFELDKSALYLAERCNQWTAEIIDQSVSFSNLNLVPAPKSSAWTFIPNKCPTECDEILDVSIEEFGNSCYCLKWVPESKPNSKKPKNIKLRPLAHIGIKEQTMMTLVMMCLANEVEAIQGDPSTKYEDVHKKKVVSYGNRLYCKYQENNEGNVTAEHNYGATTIYSKYFTDYRNFIQRPYFFASKALPEKAPNEEIYLVDLDLSQFFDRINRKTLIEKIQNITSNNQQNKIKENIATDNLLNIFHNWSWSQCAKDNYEVCKTKDVPELLNGLPQGLVASGFLSNIYMLEFDKEVQNSIETEVSKSIKLIDYCRYVDDMRLVVIGPKRSKDNKNPIKTVQEKINQWIEPQLKELSLILNPSKTKVEVYRGKSKGISSTLEMIQSNMSGPLSMESADEMVTQLESLLMLSDGNVPDQDGQNCIPNGLAAIEKSVFDIREDTLKRFAANKISKVLNNKRHFTPRNIDENGAPVAGEWDYLQERMARRFIANWSHDPALVLLLKKGLELFPSPKILNAILDQLKDVLKREGGIKEEKQASVARYCLSEIFRNSAMVIHRKDPQAIPAHADIDSYFELLQNTAAAALSGSLGGKPKSSDEFDLLGEQARFLLLVRLDTSLESSCGDLEQDLIFMLIQGYRNISIERLFKEVNIVDRFKIEPEILASCILIAAQLAADQKPVIRAVCCLFDRLKFSTPSILKKISAQNPDLMRAIYYHARAMKYTWYYRDKHSLNDIAERLYLNIRPSAKPLDQITGFTGIYQLCSRADNPFANEVMALKLFQALLEKLPVSDFKDSELVDLSRTKVKSIGYKVPPVFSAFDDDLIIEKLVMHEAIAEMSPHFKKTEDKSNENDETIQLQRVALAMRAVLAGSADPTGFGQSFTPRAGYRGVKSTSFKRQLGMMTTPESLAGEAAQFSTWLSTLLAKLLRWPGIHVNDQGFDWPRELTKDAVRDLVINRLTELKASYCQLSEMPVLPELIRPDWEKGKTSLSVAMVQSKLPSKSDFAKAGTLLDVPEYRVKHRRHVARVAELVVKHIDAQNIEVDKKQEVDLIVWPELAVHKDDLDILIHLSRKTHAIVLAGLGFINQLGVPGPNNCAIWIVPRKHNGNQNELLRFQGKHHMMAGERDLKIQPWRPYQLMIELKHPDFKNKSGFKITSATCFDATDIKLSADLRDKSNALCIPALNTDVGSFDTMVEALHYHMYQPVILVNSGEFGSSYAMAPYKERHKRLIAHASGNNQVAINTFEMNMFDFRRDGVGQSMTSGIDPKTPPAGVKIKI